MRLASDDAVSTLLTPAGLAIEGGVQGAVTNRYGYHVRVARRRLPSLPVAQVPEGSATGTRRAAVHGGRRTPWGPAARALPRAGRLRREVGQEVLRPQRLRRSRRGRSASDAAQPVTLYSPVVERQRLRRRPAAPSTPRRLQPRCPWLLLANYNSNGYRGRGRRRGRVALRALAAQPHRRRGDPADVQRRRLAAVVLARAVVPRRPDRCRAEPPVELDVAASGRCAVTNPDGTTTELGTAILPGQGEVRRRSHDELDVDDHVEAARLRPLHGDGDRVDRGRVGTPVRREAAPTASGLRSA